MGETPTSVSELKAALEEGRAFVSECRRTRIYIEFIETVGPVRTDTNTEGGEPFTTSASHDELQLALRLGLWEISTEEIPTRGEP